MRKDAQRLADEAVRQYKVAKRKVVEKAGLLSQRTNFLWQFARAEETPEAERTPEQKAIIKQYHEEDWEQQFKHKEYDYDDDWQR